MLSRGFHALSLVAAAVFLAAAISTPQGYALAKNSHDARPSIIKGFVKQVNKRQVTAAARRFDASALLRVTNHTYRGRTGVTAWLRDQVRHSAHLELRSSIHVSGSATADVAVMRTTHAGDCPHGCSERWTWQINGTRIQGLTVLALKLPAPLPDPVKTIPPPPSAPPPAVTPTIPT